MLLLLPLLSCCCREAEADATTFWICNAAARLTSSNDVRGAFPSPFPSPLLLPPSMEGRRLERTCSKPVRLLFEAAPVAAAGAPLDWLEAAAAAAKPKECSDRLECSKNGGGGC